MRWTRKQWLYALFLVALMLQLVVNTLAATNQTHTLDTSTYHFKYTDGSRLKFDASTIYLGDSNGLWTWMYSNGTRFYNLRVGDTSECPSNWYICVSGPANVTVLTLFVDDLLRLTISAAVNVTSTTQIYCSNRGEPTDIVPDSADAGYDATSKVQTLQITHSSSETVRVSWVAEYHESPEVSGGTIVDDIDFLMLYLQNLDLIGFFVACYTTRIGEAFYALVMLAFSVVLYNRTESLPLCCILWLLVGGLGFIAAAPSISPFAVILMSLGIIGLIYKVVWGGP